MFIAGFIVGTIVAILGAIALFKYFFENGGWMN